MNETTSITELDDYRTQLWGSFLDFCKVFFPLVTGRKFAISSPTCRESHFISIARELTLCKRMQNNSLLINVPPGSGKSTLLSMWVAWTMSEFPDSQYLYVSYGHELAAKHTEFIRRIISCPNYVALFGISIRNDMKAKDHFVNNYGGSVKAFGSSGPITGCFDYDAQVATTNGYISIGALVEGKINADVYSYDTKTKAIELKPVVQWFTNPANDIVRVTFDDGSHIECTPDHKIWTLNRGWVLAHELNNRDILNSIVLPYSPDNVSVQSKLSSKSTNFIRRINDGIKLFLSNSLDFLSVCRANAFCMSGTYSAHPYVYYGATANAISNCNVKGSFASAPAFTNINNSIFREFSKRVVSPMFVHIVNILNPGAITKIVNIIVKRIAIKMSDVSFVWALSNESQANQIMNRPLKPLPISKPKRNPFITGSANPWFKYFPFIWNNESVFVSDNSVVASNKSRAGCGIEFIGARYKTPLNIRWIRHVQKTYCLEVKDNHNFIIKCGDGSIVVSNCDAGLPNQDRFTGAIIMDDLLKPDEAHSTTIREGVTNNYRETILQRPRAPNVPMIYIGQRLHEDDICAHMLSGNDERIWKPVILQALDGAGNALYPEVNPLEQLLEKKLKNPYVFSSQYQQEPVPSGGALFKERDFEILDEEPEFVCTFLTVDTAETSKTYNDASVFSFWGLYKIADYGQEQEEYALHWIDCWEMRVEPKELEANFKSFWSECMLHKTKPRIAAIEKKSTGVTLCSILSDMRGLEVREVKRTKASGSKTARYLEMQPIIASKLVSFTRGAKHLDMCVKHMLKITANDSHRFADIIDTCYDAVKIALIDKTLWMRDAKTQTQRTASRLNAQEFNQRLAAIKAARGY